MRQEVAETRGGKQVMCEVPGSEFTLPCDLALIAIGFTGPDPEGIISQLGCELDNRGNVKVDDAYMTSVPSIFSAGDARRGQSLVVWAISEGAVGRPRGRQVPDGAERFAVFEAVLNHRVSGGFRTPPI